MVRCYCETRMFGVIHHCLMTPALQASIAVVTVASGQRPTLRKVHRFLELMGSCAAFRRKVLTAHAVPVTFENFENEGWEGWPPYVGTLSYAQEVSYRRICAPNANDELTMQLMQHAANYMIKKQINMSWDQIGFAPTEEDQEMMDNKLGHNKGDEQTFSRIDWRNVIA
jgi:hypothetical protein